MKRTLWIALAALLALGCGEIENQNQFIVRVTQIAEGGVVSADTCVLEQDSFGNFFCTIPEDLAVARLENKPNASALVIDPVNYALDFQLTGYSVSYSRIDGGAESGAGWAISNFNFTAGMSAVVPINGFADVGVLVAPAGMKVQEPFLSEGYVQMVADIVFTGHSVLDPDDTIQVFASVPVNVADFADD